MSVWVEINKFWIFLGIISSRSTWACELKYHTKADKAAWKQVTLHVSVWVEIQTRGLFRERLGVTLHVSVWVEIERSFFATISIRSRSTWACELKYNLRYRHMESGRHAPRERVSWNANSLPKLLAVICHAPRERVSWNLQGHATASNWNCHAPRERVSWNHVCAKSQL